MKKKSQKKDILEYMQKHGSITPQEALSEFGCFRLAARISELKNKHGIGITTAIETENGKVHARYVLEGDGEEVLLA